MAIQNTFVVILALIFNLGIADDNVIKLSDGENCGSEFSWSFVNYDSVNISAPLLNVNGLRASQHSCISFPVKFINEGSILINVYIQVRSKDSGIDVLLFKDDKSSSYKSNIYKFEDNFKSGWYRLKIPVDSDSIKNIFIVGYSQKKDLVIIDSVQYLPLIQITAENHLPPILAPINIINKKSLLNSRKYKPDELNKGDKGNILYNYKENRDSENTHYFSGVRKIVKEVKDDNNEIGRANNFETHENDEKNGRNKEVNRKIAGNGGSEKDKNNGGNGGDEEKNGNDGVGAEEDENNEGKGEGEEDDNNEGNGEDEEGDDNDEGNGEDKDGDDNDEGNGEDEEGDDNDEGNGEHEEGDDNDEGNGGDEEGDDNDEGNGEDEDGDDNDEGNGEDEEGDDNDEGNGEDEEGDDNDEGNGGDEDGDDNDEGNGEDEDGDDNDEGNGEDEDGDDNDEGNGEDEGGDDNDEGNGEDEEGDDNDEGNGEDEEGDDNDEGNGEDEEGDDNDEGNGEDEGGDDNDEGNGEDEEGNGEDEEGEDEEGDDNDEGNGEDEEEDDNDEGNGEDEEEDDNGEGNGEDEEEDDNEGDEEGPDEEASKEEDGGFWNILTISLVSVGGAMVLIIVVTVAYYAGTLRTKPVVVLEDIEPPKTMIIPRVKDVYNNNPVTVINFD